MRDFLVKFFTFLFISPWWYENKEKEPTFLFPETKKRYFDLKGEIIKRKIEAGREAYEVGKIKYTNAYAEIKKIELRMVNLRTFDPTERRERELQNLSAQLEWHHKTMPDHPKVIARQLSKSLAEMRSRIDSIAKAAARKEERERVVQKGELVYLSPNGKRRIFYFRDRYFLLFKNTWVTDSWNQFSVEEVEAIRKNNVI